MLSDIIDNLKVTSEKGTVTISAKASADLIDNNLALGEKSGYKFIVTGNSSGYAISAVPVSYNSTGSRTFYSDQTLVVRNNWSQEPANPNSPEIK